MKTPSSYEEMLKPLLSSEELSTWSALVTGASDAGSTSSCTLKIYKASSVPTSDHAGNHKLLPPVSALTVTIDTFMVLSNLLLEEVAIFLAPMALHSAST